jgi:pimeloyl-ACP methyl ester carboxylesterase
VNVADFAAAFPDRAVYLVNYRGYGGSTGRPSEAALLSDAVATYDWVAARHDRIAVVGRSLGSGVAVALAAQRPVDRLVLVTPFDSIANVAADHFPFFPVRWLLRDRYDSLQRIGEVRAPVLVLIAEHDEVVRRARSDALIAAIPADIRHTVLIRGATHNDISSFPAYWQTLQNFLALAN